jgi:hypothetical protein
MPQARSSSDANQSPGRRGIDYGRLLAALVVWCVVLAGLGALAGNLAAGRAGMLGALAGAGVTVVFAGSTALVMGLTRRKSVQVAAVWLVVSWVVKMAALMAAFAFLDRADWYSRPAFGIAVLVGVAGSLALDARLVLSARQPPAC